MFLVLGWLVYWVVGCLSVVYGNLIRGLLLYLFLTIRSLFNFMLSVVDFNLEAKSRTWGGNVWISSGVASVVVSVLVTSSLSGL